MPECKVGSSGDHRTNSVVLLRQLGCGNRPQKYHYDDEFNNNIPNKSFERLTSGSGGNEKKVNERQRRIKKRRH